MLLISYQRQAQASPRESLKEKGKQTIRNEIKRTLKKRQLPDITACFIFDLTTCSLYRLQAFGSILTILYKVMLMHFIRSGKSNIMDAK